ncbi:MAG: carbon-nitrogen hydrolase family protein [Nitrospinae bacterium]|nr:carbon-nitrogen hydrolase family protein [Nitrospinota bacterium]
MIVAAVQTLAGSDIRLNVSRAVALVEQAVSKGAQLVALPEYFAYHGPEETWAKIAQEGEAILAQMSALAASSRIFLLAGSVLLPSGVEGKSLNVSVLFDPDGRELARYAKVHLFDAVTEKGAYKESQWLVPGASQPVANVAGWSAGFSICFDLRFPEHFISLRGRGADVIFAPSAFTMETGKSHWTTLIKSRAMDTQCYIVAPALCGGYSPSRQLYGHTSIVDPWSDIMGAVEDGEGLAVAELSKTRLQDIRRSLPLR